MAANPVAKIAAVPVAKIAAVVAAYWTISISMVFANKYLVGGSSTADISLFVSWLQCIVTVALTLAMRAVGTRRREVPLSAALPPREHFVARPVLTMSACFVCMLSFNNMCLKLVGVSFYQVARSTTIIFVVIFSVLILKKSVSKAVVFCCALVASGFFLGIDQEKVIGTLSVRGVVFGVTSSVFIALTGVFTKSALEVVERDELALTLCTNAVAAGAFVPVVLLTGQAAAAIPQLSDPWFWVLIVGTGSVGTALSWISNVQINVTSPITHHVSANSKAIAQTIIAVLWYSETKSVLWWISVILVVAGACSYALVRLREEKAAAGTAAVVIGIPGGEGGAARGEVNKEVGMDRGLLDSVKGLPEITVGAGGTSKS